MAKSKAATSPQTDQVPTEALASLSPELNHLLNALQSGVVTVEAKTGKILALNALLQEWIGMPAEPPTSFDALVSIIGKTACPVGSLKPGVMPPKPELKWQPQIGTLLMGPQEGSKVKIKYHPLETIPGAETVVMCQLDPFAEDMSLTQAHNEFVSTVSHEFRTPLTSIKGFADTLLRYGGQLPEDQRKRFITIIKDQADRLTRLVENLLSVSKLGAGRVNMVYRPVAATPLVEKIAEQLVAKGVQDPRVKRHFEVNMPAKLPDMWADLDKIEQVLINLIDNGAKYSFADSTVVMTADILENGDKLAIHVTNHGVGIPEDKLPRIFSQFSRIENPLTRDVEGTGLGLYITKSLALAMGGDIQVKSVPNETTTFTVIMPTATAERQEGYRRKLLLAGQTEEQEA
jgi:signal transduction histidine kinase